MKKITFKKVMPVLILLFIALAIAAVTIFMDYREAQNRPVYEKHYLTMSEFAQYQALDEQYSNVFMELGILHEMEHQHTKLLNKKHPTEDDLLMINMYDKSIAEQGKRIAQLPSADELRAQMDALGSTTPITDGEYAEVWAEVKRSSATTQSTA